MEVTATYTTNQPMCNLVRPHPTIPHYTTQNHAPKPHHNTTPYHTAPYHTTSYYTIPYHTTLYHTKPYHTTLCTPYHAILDCSTLYRIADRWLLQCHQPLTRMDVIITVIIMKWLMIDSYIMFHIHFEIFFSCQKWQRNETALNEVTSSKNLCNVNS